MEAVWLAAADPPAGPGDVTGTRRVFKEPRINFQSFLMRLRETRKKISPFSDVLAEVDV